MNIDIEIVKELIREQFPKWSNLEVRCVEKSGHDNRTFHLGEKMSVRLPSGYEYAAQIEKEILWLPKFKPHISCVIPSPIAKGNPSDSYPFSWSINTWIEGDVLNYNNVEDFNKLAIDIAKFLNELQAIDTTNGPIAGSHNFHRGGLLKVYDKETIEALKYLESVFPREKLINIWMRSLESLWDKSPVWVHGDLATGNILVKDGKLFSVIDFGILGVGDPACDYVMAWTFFDDESREIFKECLNCDDDTWNRAKGWALWKALISYDINHQDSEVSLWAKRTINEILNEEIN